jgi:putative SOS response-associated peptidase YedK
MIERYSITASAEKILERFGAEVPEHYAPHYNASPTQLLPIITQSAPTGISTFYWGISPEWSKNKTPGEKLINTRLEAIQEKTSLQRSLMKNRCLIPADSFYGWKRAGKKTFIPYRFVCTDQELFSFAGLWDEYEDTDGNEIHTFSIITVPSNKLVEGIQDRMPAILDKKLEAAWLSPEASPSDLINLLQAYPIKSMNHYPVSPRISDSKTDVPSLIIPTPPADQHGNLTLFD